MISEGITINLTSTYAEITTTTGSTKQTKLITLDMFRSLMAIDSVTTPFFPFHVVKYLSENNKVFIMTCDKVNILEYFILTGQVNHDGTAGRYDTMKYHIPYLYFIWKLSKTGLNDYKIVDTRLYCSFNVPSEDTITYIPKLGNVYDDGRICWGRNEGTYDAFTNLIHLHEMQQIFLRGVHTNEMTINNTISINNGKIFKTETEFTASGLTKGNPAKLITRFNQYVSEGR